MALEGYKLKDGDVADIVLMGVPVSFDNDGNLLVGGVVVKYDPTMMIAERIIRRNPDNWPPKANDVWKADGITFHALYKPVRGMRFHVSDGFKPAQPRKVLAIHPDLTLAFRDGKKVEK